MSEKLFRSLRETWRLTPDSGSIVLLSINCLLPPEPFGGVLFPSWKRSQIPQLPASRGLTAKMFKRSTFFWSNVARNCSNNDASESTPSWFFSALTARYPNPIVAERVATKGSFRFVLQTEWFRNEVLCYSIYSVKVACQSQDIFQSIFPNEWCLHLPGRC